MNTNTIPQLVNDDISINLLEAVKSALAKFPRVRNPATVIPAVSYRPRVLRPRIYYRAPSVYEVPKFKARRVKRELLNAGVTVYGLMKAESRYLHKILHDNEHIEAAIYGQHHASSAMLIATDERIIYLDKKPMVELFDEVSYEVVSGIEFDIHMFFASVVLHTPVKNYDFKLVNLKCAEKFARHIEKQRLERENKEEQVAEPAEQSAQQAAETTEHELEDMAGYYWLPTDEEERRRVQQVNL